MSVSKKIILGVIKLQSFDRVNLPKNEGGGLKVMWSYGKAVVGFSNL